MGVWNSRLSEARVPGSSIPTPTSPPAGGRRSSPAEGDRQCGALGRVCPEGPQARHSGTALGAWPVWASLWGLSVQGRGSSCLCLLFWTLHKRSPCSVLFPGPGKVIFSVSPGPLNCYKGLIQGRDPRVNLPRFFGHLWTKEILGLGCTFWTSPLWGDWLDSMALPPRTKLKETNLWKLAQTPYSSSVTLKSRVYHGLTLRCIRSYLPHPPRQPLFLCLCTHVHMCTCALHQGTDSHNQSHLLQQAFSD